VRAVSVDDSRASILALDRSNVDKPTTDDGDDAGDGSVRRSDGDDVRERMRERARVSTPREVRVDDDDARTR
tara:strand:+ start:92 stop:307 length:216 start_codon:yes stop_codon:yes gene_type:complete